MTTSADRLYYAVVISTKSSIEVLLVGEPHVHLWKAQKFCSFRDLVAERTSKISIAVGSCYRENSEFKSSLRPATGAPA